MEEMVGLFRNHCFLSFFLNRGLRLLQGVYEPAQRREEGKVVRCWERGETAG